MVRLDEKILARLLENPAAECCCFEGAVLSRGQFAGLIELCRTNLVASGFKAGNRLALLLPNSPLMLAVCTAAWQLGGSVIPMSPLVGPELVMGMIKMMDPFAVILPDVKEVNPFAAQLTALDAPVTRVSLAAPLPVLPARDSAIGDNSIAVIFATSGTTGTPKAVPLTHSNVLSNIEATCQHVYLEPNMPHRVLNLLPNFHTFGFCLSGVLPLVMGYSQVLLPSFMPPARSLQALYEQEITVLIAVPTIVGMLCEAIARAQMPPPPYLKMVICGGSAVSARLYERTKALLGVHIHEGYGLTECSPVVAAVRRPEDGQAGRIGPMIPGFEHQLRDMEDQIIDNKEGILWLKGPSVCAGYCSSPEGVASRFDGPWFNTGDVVRLHDDGSLSILDRANDIIIVGGFNVYPQEVETCLMGHPSVQEAAVVGSPNAMSGEFVKAFVIPAEGVDPSARELIRFCKERLAPYKTPRKVEFVTEMPRNAIGKVLRRKLRDLECQRAAENKTN